MKVISIAALLLLASCTAEPTQGTTGTRAAHRTAPTDTTETAPGSISFDLSDTTMEDDTLIIEYHAEEWEGMEQDADP